MNGRTAGEFITQRLAALVLLTLVVILLDGCSRNATSVSTGLPPVDSQVEAMINNYEKLSSQYLHLQKKLKDGDVSITVRYIEVAKETRQESIHLKEVSNRMTPLQAQRVATISNRTGALMQE